MIKSLTCQMVEPQIIIHIFCYFDIWCVLVVLRLKTVKKTCKHLKEILNRTIQQNTNAVFTQDTFNVR